MFRHGQELHVTAYAAQKIVYLASASRRAGVYGGEGVVLHAVALQEIDGGHHAVERSAALSVGTESVVYVARTVDRYSD